MCRGAARDLLARHGRPVPAAVVVPLPEATRVVLLDGFPDDDEGRRRALAGVAHDVLAPVNAPCWGFVAEASLTAGEAAGADVLLVAYGARGHDRHATAAALVGDEPGEFSAAEPLDPAALPFLSPLQAAADAAAPDRPPGGVGVPGFGRG